jgi:hypothetical protein
MPKLIYHDSDGIDKVLLLSSDPVMIGRATECQVQTQDAMVSRRHARIYWDGNYWIEDLGSSNGVYVGNEKVQKAPFRPGDTVTCGSLVLRLMPDTSPRVTGAMTPQPQPPRSGLTPPVGAPHLGAPPPMAPPPMAPPPMASPPVAYSAPTGSMPPTMAPPARGEIQIGPNAVLRGAVAPPSAVTGAQPSFTEELRVERERREQAEAAVLQQAERIKAVESTAAQQLERLKTAEARVAELEGLTREASLLKRKLDQAQADMRRLRGGQPLEERSDSGEADKLRARVDELESELTAARAAAAAATATAAAPAPASSPSDVETVRLKRQVEQLQSELRRARAGQPEPAAAPPPPSPPPAAPAPARPDPAMADAAIALGDSLAELRSSLRAANDEAGLLTAPSESVQVVADALRGAAEQLEAARGHLRTLGRFLGVS